MLTDVQKHILAEIANLHKVPTGAYSIRANGETAGLDLNAYATMEVSERFADL
ncbi:MAG: hypothetical protein IJV74_00850 [Clostridia bacterium]|nr:hypothetical protein [Clostridia bacterium]